MKSSSANGNDCFLIKILLLIFLIISCVNLLLEKNIKLLNVNSTTSDFISQKDKDAVILKKNIYGVSEIGFIFKDEVMFDKKLGDYLPTLSVSQYIFAPFVLKVNETSSKYLILYCSISCKADGNDKLLGKSGNYYLYLNL